MKSSELVCSPPSITRVGQQQHLAFEKSFGKALGASQLDDVLGAVEDGPAGEAQYLSFLLLCHL